MQAGEAGVDVTTVEDNVDGDGGYRRQTGEFRGVIVDDLPDGGSARLPGR